MSVVYNPLIHVTLQPKQARVGFVTFGCLKSLLGQSKSSLSSALTPGS